MANQRRLFLMILFLFMTALPVLRADVAGSEDAQASQAGKLTAPNVPADKGAATGTPVPAAKTVPLSGYYPPPESPDAMPNEQLADALWKATRQVGVAAKSIGQSFGDYVRDKQLQRRQRELVERFYFALNNAARGLDLNAVEYRELISRVEKIYIEDGETGQYGLDPLYFREMPQVIKKEFADIVFARTKNGVVDTYYLSGALKTRWQLREGSPEGIVSSYYEDGEILYIDTYKNGMKISRKKFNHEGRLEFEQAYVDPANTGQGLRPAG